MVKRVLITGASGFIGTNLSHFLRNKGMEVVGVDLLPPLQLSIYKEFYQEDILSPSLWDELEGQGIEAVVHLAAISSVPECFKEESKCYEVNVEGTCRVVRYAKREGIKVIFSSSAAVYGDHKGIVNEQTSAHPISLYGKYKLEGESIVKEVRRHTIFRLFNVYGRHQKQGVIPILIERARNGQNLEIFGSGEQIRDFIYVEDVCKAIYLALTVFYDERELYNLSTAQGTRIIDLANLIISLTHSNSKIIFKPPRKGDIQISIGDNKNITSAYALSFTPLREGINKILSSGSISKL